MLVHLCAHGALTLIAELVIIRVMQVIYLSFKQKISVMLHGRLMILAGFYILLHMQNSYL